MQIALTNIEIKRVVLSILNARKTMEAVPGRINLRLDEAMSAIKDQYLNFVRRLPQIQKDHIVSDSNGNFKEVRDPLGRRRYVFKSVEDEQVYLDVTEAEYTFHIKGLREADLEAITTSDDEFGKHHQHFKHLKLITKGHHNAPSKDNTNQTDEEE